MSRVCSDQQRLHQLIDDDDDDELDPYSSDHFRMYEFKVRQCTRSRSHDWTDCPFAHPSEKARRRDPRRYHYSGAICPEFRHGGCSRGDSCEFAHGVFECWLHPSRYRTEACKDGKNCKRKVCFFAHTPRQLRIPCDASSCNTTTRKYKPGQSVCCCLVGHSVSSPTSTLFHLSPPMSPSERRRMLRSSSGGAVSYKDVLNELMSSLEAMNFNEAAALCSPLSRASSWRRSRANSTHWIDASFDDDDDHHQQQQFILSPSTPSPSGSGSLFDGNFSRNNNDGGLGGDENGNGFGSSDPDLGWVNDLLM